MASPAEQAFAEAKGNGQSPNIRTPDVVLASDVPPLELRYLHWPYVARRRVALVVGNPGTGKGLYTCNLGGASTRGGYLPDQQGKMTMRAPIGDVIFMSAEDGYEEGLVPRLIAAQADLERVWFLRGIKGADGDGNRIVIRHFLNMLIRQFRQKPHAWL